jgi:hypothetical protein
MPLSPVEQSIVDRIVDVFVDEKKAITRKELVTSFRNVDAIDGLYQRRILTSSDALNFLPGAIAFHFCSRSNIEDRVRQGVKTLASVLQRLYPVDQAYFTQIDILSVAREINPLIDQLSIRLALYVAPDLRLASGITLDSSSTDIARISGINERVVEIENGSGIWDEFVTSYLASELRRDSANLVSGIKPGTSGTPKQKNPTAAVDNSENSRSTAQTPRRKDVNKLEWLPPGWKIERSLPEGGQGWTYIVVRKNGSDRTKYVLKRLKNKNRLKRFQKEIEVLKKLSHPSIVRIVESYAEDQPIYVSEYCEKGDLTKVDLSRKTLLEKLLIFRQICDAMATAHAEGIIHRDLKPENILVRGNDTIAVGDFGLCLDLADVQERLTTTTEAVGARHYIAPEMEDGRAIDPRPVSDCYSLGKLLYYLLTGRSFARERHREEGFNLLTPTADPYLTLVYEILDGAIVQDVEVRYKDASELLTSLNEKIFQIQNNAHVLDMRMPQRCLFCIVGRYQRMINMDELRLVCTNCGNIQFFGGSNNWWKFTKQ